MRVPRRETPDTDSPVRPVPAAGPFPDFASPNLAGRRFGSGRVRAVVSPFGSKRATRSGPHAKIVLEPPPAEINPPVPIPNDVTPARITPAIRATGGREIASAPAAVKGKAAGIRLEIGRVREAG